ncbi:MAG: hypothetical protein ACREWG_14890 [Gammaproteobacteria bacterium]
MARRNAIYELSQLWSLPPEEVEQKIDRNLMTLLAKSAEVGE